MFIYLFLSHVTWLKTLTTALLTGTERVAKAYSCFVWFSTIRIFELGNFSPKSCLILRQCATKHTLLSKCENVAAVAATVAEDAEAVAEDVAAVEDTVVT